jgi:hypothetical protein
MAKGDYRIQSGGFLYWKYNVQDRTTSSLTRVIYPGEPLKLYGGTAGSQFVYPLETGDPEIGTDFFVGIAATESTETSTADGTIWVYVAIPGVTVMAAKATTSANVDTQSEIDALLNDTICGDVSSLTYTIDEDEGTDDNVHGFVVVGGNPDTKELYFTVKSRASVLGSHT